MLTYSLYYTYTIWNIYVYMRVNHRNILMGMTATRTSIAPLFSKEFIQFVHN